MGKRRVKRYYRPLAIDLNGIDVVRKILNDQFRTDDLRRYRLLYAAEELEVNAFDDVSQLFASKGPTTKFSILAKSSGGRYALFDSTGSNFIVVEYYSGQIDPETQVAKIAESLGLRPINRLIESAFIAHGFDDKGKAYATLVAQFLQLLGIRISTGEYFEPTSVSEKVKERIAKNDMFVAIVTPQDDRTWIIQETTYADSLGKEPFVLVETSADHKRGLRGDKEDIMFPNGHVSDSFNKILQGLHKLRGTAAPM